MPHVQVILNGMQPERCAGPVRQGREDRLTEDTRGAKLSSRRLRQSWGTLPLHSPHALQQHFLDQANWHSSKIGLHSQETHAFASIGLLGGFTTFSTFSHQTLTLWQADRFAAVGVNVVLNVALGLFAAWLGWRLGRVL